MDEITRNLKRAAETENCEQERDCQLEEKEQACEVPGKDCNANKMKTYIGTKIVRACEMDNATFRQMVDESSVKKKKPDINPGYMVMYEDGYKSWCPKAVFEGHNRKISNAEIKMLLSY